MRTHSFIDLNFHTGFFSDFIINSNPTTTLQLEEFRRKREASLAAKSKGSGSAEAAGSTGDPRLTAIESHKDSEEARVTRSATQVTPDSPHEVEALRAQVSQLLESIDGLHRALNDERYNSSKIEEKMQQENSVLRQRLVDLQNIAANIDESNTRMQQLESDLQSKEQELVALKAEAQSKEEKVTMVMMELKESETSAAKLNVELEKKREVIEDLKQKLSEQTSIEEVNKRLQEEESEKIKNLEATIADLQKSLAFMQSEFSAAQELATSRQGAIDQLREEVETAKVQEDLVREQQSLLEELEKLLSVTRQELQKVREDASYQLESSSAEFEEKEAALRKELESYEAALQTAQQEAALVPGLRAECEKLQASLAETSDSSTLEQLRSLQEEMETIMSQKTNLESKLSHAAAEQQLAEQKVSALSKELSVLMEQTEALLSENAFLKSACEELKEREQLLKDALQANAVNAVNAANAANAQQQEADLVPSLREQVSLLENRLAMLQSDNATLTKDVEERKMAAATLLSTSQAKDVQLQTLIRRTEELERLLKQSTADLGSVKLQLEAEHRRAEQLEALSQRQVARYGDKKDEDNAADPEAAAMAGGSAFKPLIGLVRSWPPPFSHTLLCTAAREVDRVAIALDARPIWRLLVLVYGILLHLVALLRF